jgi:uncharacterized protein YkwD
MPSAHALAPSHRATTPRRARRLAATTLLAVLAALLVLPSAPTVAATRYEKLEKLALSLMNCTRSGGWVLKDGSCKGRNSGRFSKYVKPIPLSDGISDKVAYPYAVRLAQADACMHTLAGTSIDGRFRRAGYKGSTNGESIGCSNGYTARQMVIRTHRMMQSEKSYNGWHWRNMKDRDWKRVGIGVAMIGSESRVVYDFYGH